MSVEIMLHGEIGRAYGSALVSPEDAELVGSFKWWVQVNSWGGAYAYTWAKDADGKLARPRKKLYMHRLVAQSPKGRDADHRNGKTLDNRRSNLRNVVPSIHGGRTNYLYANDPDYEAYVEEVAAHECAMGGGLLHERAA